VKKLMCVLAASLACATVGAQTANFGGLSGALNVNTVSMNTKITSDGDAFDGIGKQSWNGSAQVAYGFVATPSIVISVGGTFSLGTSKAGTLQIGGDSVELRYKNASSLYVEPGFLLNEKTLAYGKLSYEAAKGVVAVSGESETSKSIKGTGFGVGVRTMLDKTSFIQVELKQVNYRGIDIANVASLKPKAAVGTIGLGMTF